MLQGGLIVFTFGDVFLQQDEPFGLIVDHDRFAHHSQAPSVGTRQLHAVCLETADQFHSPGDEFFDITGAVDAITGDLAQDGLHRYIMTDGAVWELKQFFA